MRRRLCRGADEAVPSSIKCHWVGWVNWLAIFHSQTLTFHRFPFQLRLSFITLPFPCCYYHSTPLSHLLTHVCMPRSLSLSLRIQTFLNDENFFQPFLLPSFFLCIEKAFIKQNTSDVRWVLISLLPVVLLARLQGNKALSCATLLHKLRFFWVCLQEIRGFIESDMFVRWDQFNKRTRLKFDDLIGLLHTWRFLYRDCGF